MTKLPTELAIIVELERAHGRGALVAALERGSGVEAVVLGKPARPFFEAAAERHMLERDMPVGAEDPNASGAQWGGGLLASGLTGCSGRHGGIRVSPGQRPRCSAVGSLPIA